MSPTYLGDGVYAHDDGYHIVLTTGHHDPALADNTIYLDGGVIRGLLGYIEQARAARRS